MTDSMIGVLFAIYLADVVGLNPALAAVSVFIGRTADYVNDPIMGYISDRARSRWGRRRPFILFGFIPYALTFALMWWIPPIGSVGLAITMGQPISTTPALLYLHTLLRSDLADPDYDERTLTNIRMEQLRHHAGVYSAAGDHGTMRPKMPADLAWRGDGVLAALPYPDIFGVRAPRAGKIPALLKESLQAAGERPFYINGIFLFT
jgi:hypothetical protein